MTSFGWDMLSLPGNACAKNDLDSSRAVHSKSVHEEFVEQAASLFVLT